MRIIRDVLDNQLVDRKKKRIGKVDGIIVVLREGRPPRLDYIEVGMATLAYRLHPRLGRWAEAIGRKWGLKHGKPFRIPWSKIRDIGIDVDVDLEAEETPLLDGEKWLKKHVIERIPGA